MRRGRRVAAVVIYWRSLRLGAVGRGIIVISRYGVTVVVIVVVIIRSLPVAIGWILGLLRAIFVFHFTIARDMIISYHPSYAEEERDPADKKTDTRVSHYSEEKEQA